MPNLQDAAAILAESLLKTAVANDQHRQAEQIRKALASFFESGEPSLADLGAFLESLSSIARTMHEGGPRGAGL